MAKQPEQILEEQLVAQLQKLGYGLCYFSTFKTFKINNIKNLTLKMFAAFKKEITFAPTVLATLKSERSAYQGESFAFIGFPQYNNTPPLPHLQFQKAHLGGLFFYSQF
jgi:hypothetical protein